MTQNRQPPSHPGAARPDTDDMLMIHASFRREFALAPTLVTANAVGARIRARRVAGHLALIAKSLHDHHAGEDAVLWPALRATGRVPPELLDGMLHEHHQLAADLTDLERTRRAWARIPDQTRSEELATLLSRVHTEVTHHLDHEETQVLPLVRAHLAVRGWNDLAAESRRRLPRSPRRQLLLLGILLEDATPAQRHRVGQQMPTPARWLWCTVGQRYYDGYIRRLRGPTF